MEDAMQTSDLGLSGDKIEQPAQMRELTQTDLDNATRRAFGMPIESTGTVITRRDAIESIDTREAMLRQVEEENAADRRYLDAFNAEAERWTKALNTWSIRICAGGAIWAVIWWAFS